MIQHRGQGLSMVLGHPQEVDPGLLKTKADWTGKPQASRWCRSAHPTHVSRNGSQMTAWPPGDTLVLTWPKLQLKGGVGAGLWRGRAGPSFTGAVEQGLSAPMKDLTVCSEL